MEFVETPIKGLWEVRLSPRLDERGYFMRTYDVDLFVACGLHTSWVQENQSMSVHAGTVRGLHFQRPPHSETKFVRALAGALLDVAVDLRDGSPTYGQHYAIELTASNGKCLYIPKGFAHGFCTLQPHTIVAYKVDHAYAPQSEGGLRWNDPKLRIAWPIDGEPSTISTKDAQWPSLDQLEPLPIPLPKPVASHGCLQGAGA
jgi:dTDP-4-dehydrorhamnose 3,5-epimerase